MLAYIMPLCHVHSFMKVTIHRTAEVFSTMLPGIRLLSNVIVFMTVINTEFGEGFSKMYRSIWLLYFVSYFYLSKHVTYLNVLPHCLQMYLFSSIWLFLWLVTSLESMKDSSQILHTNCFTSLWISLSFWPYGNLTKTSSLNLFSVWVLSWGWSKQRLLQASLHCWFLHGFSLGEVSSTWSD